MKFDTFFSSSLSPHRKFSPFFLEHIFDYLICVLGPGTQNRRCISYKTLLPLLLENITLYTSPCLHLILTIKGVLLCTTLCPYLLIQLRKYCQNYKNKNVCFQGADMTLNPKITYLGQLFIKHYFPTSIHCIVKA